MNVTTAPPRACRGRNRRGEPCGAPPMRGSDFCCSHDPDRPAEARFGSHEQALAAGRRGGRPRKPRTAELVLPADVVGRLVAGDSAQR